MDSNCENCLRDHDHSYGSGRFCSSKCARGFSTKLKRTEINERVSKTLTGRPNGHLGLTTPQNVRDKQSHSLSEFYKKNPKERKPLLSYFQSGKKVGRAKLLEALSSIGREYKCEKCGCLPVWQNEKLIIHIDHIDGNKLNNDQANLRFLCPNCHSQTSTFGFRGVKKYTSRCGEIGSTHSTQNREVAGSTPVTGTKE